MPIDSVNTRRCSCSTEFRAVLRVNSARPKTVIWLCSWRSDGGALFYMRKRRAQLYAYFNAGCFQCSCQSMRDLPQHIGIRLHHQLCRTSTVTVASVAEVFFVYRGARGSETIDLHQSESGPSRFVCGCTSVGCVGAAVLVQRCWALAEMTSIEIDSPHAASLFMCCP